MRDGKGKRARAARVKLPDPVRRESRICFGLSWFSSEADASAYAVEVRRQGRTFNGGYFHGMSCGRAESFDYVMPDGSKRYAVTD